MGFTIGAKEQKEVRPYNIDCMIERGLIGLSAVPRGGVDMLRLAQISAGALCELAMDAVDDPSEFWVAQVDALWKAVGLDATDRDLAIDRMESGETKLFNFSDPRTLDREVESGRMLLRNVHIDSRVASENLIRPLQEFIVMFVMSSTRTTHDRSNLCLFIENTAQKALAYEMATQELCDLLIETKLVAHNWSLGDAICALAGAAAQRLAVKRASKNWSWECEYQIIADVMMREALSLGVPSTSSWEFGMAANDSRPNPPIALIKAVESSCLVFLDLINITDFETQSIVLAKAAGRMLALASVGDDPEIEAHIAKPLACHAMAETLRSFI